MKTKCPAGHLVFISIHTNALSALMSVLSESFFTFVRVHFSAFALFSTWHIVIV